jgi:type II secretory pathway component PulM
MSETIVTDTSSEVSDEYQQQIEEPLRHLRDLLSEMRRQQTEIARLREAGQAIQEDTDRILSETRDVLDRLHLAH